MPTVTASTPTALYAAAHRFVTGVRAKRSYAEAYVSALTHYLQTFTSCDYFGILAIEVKSLVDDKAVAGALRERLSAALTKAIEEKAGSIVRSLTKADIAKLLAPSLEGVEP